jgi:RimJ/RimL family protein N-acetyltransferase
MSTAGERTYPRRLACEAGEIEIRPMATWDADAVLALAKSLPAHDLLFLPRDITKPKVIQAWIAENEHGSMITLLALLDGAVVGCATVARDPLSWSRHVGELRVLVSQQVRGKGVGRVLVQECFVRALALGLEKLTAQMTVDQVGAIAVFEGLGFRGEALLRNHVKGSDGVAHDLVILSHDVARAAAQHEALGIAGAI